MNRILAVLVVSTLLTACAMPASHPGSPDALYENGLAAAKEKKYQDAVTTFRKILIDSPGSSVAADSLFQLAYIRTAYDNPHRDYALALQDFEEFIKRYPAHDRIPEAQNWRLVLKTVLELRRDNDRLNSNIEKLKNLDIRHEERRRK